MGKRTTIEEKKKKKGKKPKQNYFPCLPRMLAATKIQLYKVQKIIRKIIALEKKDIIVPFQKLHRTINLLISSLIFNWGQWT